MNIYLFEIQNYVIGLARKNDQFYTNKKEKIFNADQFCLKLKNFCFQKIF